MQVEGEREFVGRHGLTEHVSSFSMTDVVMVAGSRDAVCWGDLIPRMQRVEEGRYVWTKIFPTLLAVLAIEMFGGRRRSEITCRCVLFGLEVAEKAHGGERSGWMAVSKDQYLLAISERK